MEQGRVVAVVYQVHRLRPGAHDVRGRHEKIVEIIHGAAVHAALAEGIGVHEVVGPVMMAQAGGPDAARILYAPHVELGNPRQGAREQAPVDEIAGVVNLHAGEPFEGRCRDVIIIINPQDGRVRVESP